MPEKGILETRRNFYALLYLMYLEPPSREFVDDLMNERFYLPDLISDEELSEFYKGIARLTKGFILLEEAVIEELLETVQ